MTERGGCRIQKAKGRSDGFDLRTPWSNAARGHQHDELVAPVAHRGKTMGNDQYRCSRREQRYQPFLHRLFRGRVQVAGCFVDNQEPRLLRSAEPMPTRWASPPESLIPRRPTSVSRPSTN